ncbi:FxSxx-COOH system tetratricopeptide repeat protein [Streptomyces sp. NBC_00237]|uniref:FxSxx-COOH system tetratricopeptide repeat protein n=1 Tax=Streptomyces sp. NBC_00237 TaxID=2975687 RepID=UPI00224F47E0|nr:FxSxx-COOH system tetratricopeptide repeat protein [Streptomyces sp. NBC_00237]MCX5204503.1 FxSxx-COOH system tetratricopeptide repeat protein [Streptomyces sp. NBC_00237]
MTGGETPRSGPSWPELLDALYLAACQDNAAPYRWRPELPVPPTRPRPTGPGPATEEGCPPTDEPARTPGAHKGRKGHKGSEPKGEPQSEKRSEPVTGSDQEVGEETAREEPDLLEAATTFPYARYAASPTGRAEGGPEDPDPAEGPLRQLLPEPGGWSPPWSVLRPDGTDPARTTTVAAPLPEALALARALRPLRLYADVPDAWELDEEATAERAAQEELWVPVCRPVRERRLRLLLLVDAHFSMALWQDTVRRLRTLLEQTAAFRSLTVAPLDLSGTGPPAHDGAASPGPDSLVLVLTDGVGGAWRDGTAAAFLCSVGQSSATAVLSLMPQELWEFTLPTAVRARFDVPEPAAANRRLRLRGPALPARELGDPVRARPHGRPPVPVPVLELTPGSLGRWARLIASPGGRYDAAVLLTGAHGDLGARRHPEPEPDPPAGRTRQDRAREVVRAFKGKASPLAYALAKRLAAAPLNLPVMRLIQHSLPGARDFNLGEIMLFGLLRRTGHDHDAEDTERVSFDFPEGVREELLGLGTRAETMVVLRQVAGALGERLGHAVVGGEAAVAWEHDAADPPVNDRTRPFVRPLHTALAAVSGPYLARASRLGQLLAVGARATAPTAGNHRGARPPDVTVRDPSTTFGHPSPVPIPVPGSHETPPYGAPGGSAVSTASQTSPAYPPPSAARPARLWGNVPQRNRNFTGREDLLARLSERLTSSSLSGGTEVTAVLPEALHGMGGVGKSQIAIEYVYRNSRDYQLVWWVPSEQTSLIVQSLIELGEQMGLRVGADRSAVPAVLEALRVGTPYSNWLLVFDNAEDPYEVRKFFPNDGPGRVMVTSRNSQWSSLASSLEVDVFAREESVALIRRRSQQIPDEAADRLAESLGDLPLAVEQAAVWLAETGMPVTQYLDLFETKYAELLQTAPPPDYQLPVAAAWNVSLDRLRESHPAALQLLQVCAFFAPEPIDWDLFSAVRGVAAPTALRDTLDDPIKLGRAVREIGRYALARIDHRKSTIQVHRLVQRVLIQQMNEQERAEMRHCAHEILAHADPRNPQRPAEWPLYFSLLPHVRASGMIDCEDPWVRQLVLNETRFLLARSDYQEALEVGDRASAVWRRTLGDDHEHVLEIDQVRAEVLRWRNRYAEAFELQEKTVERCRGALGERHPATQRAVSFLALLHRARGDFFSARALDQLAYEALAREFGPDDPATLQAAHNYAVSLRLSSRAEDLEEAYRIDEDTYQRRVEVLGDDHMQTMLSLHCLYIDVQELARYQEAAEGQQQLRERALLMLGEDHPMVAWASRELSVARRKLGSHQDAFVLSREVLEYHQSRPGEDQHMRAWAALNHATDLRQTGDLDNAARLGREAMEMCREVLGSHHPHTYATATNLAVSLRLIGQVEEARSLNQAAVDGLSQLLSPQHVRTLLVKSNLASDLALMGELAPARALGEEITESSALVSGVEHPDYLAFRLNLSYDLKDLGETERAKEIYEQTVATMRTVLGAGHPAVIDATRSQRANCDIDMLSL